jgi:hypothetical protein
MFKLFFWHWKGFKRIIKLYHQEGFKTPENQDTVSNPCRWFDKIEGLLIHPRNRDFWFSLLVMKFLAIMVGSVCGYPMIA